MINWRSLTLPVAHCTPHFACFFLSICTINSLRKCVILYMFKKELPILSHRGWRESQRWWRQQRLRWRRAQSEPGAQSTTQPVNRWRQPTGQHSPQTQRCTINIHSLCEAPLATLTEINGSSDSSMLSVLQAGKERSHTLLKKML